MMSDMVDTNDIKQNLLTLGLDETEAKIYICLLNEEDLSILEISRQTNTPRTTVYRNAEELVQKNFAEWVVTENGNNVKAKRPDGLEFIIGEYEHELKKKKSALEHLQKMITGIPTGVPKTQVRYYQGVEGLRQMMWNALKAKNEIVGYSVYGRKQIVGESYNNKWITEFKARGLRDRTVVNETAIEYLKEHIGTSLLFQQGFNDVKFISKEKFYVEGDVTIYNSCYAIGFWRGDEIVGVEIENEEFVKIQRSIFEILWEVGRPLKEVFNKDFTRKK